MSCGCDCCDCDDEDMVVEVGAKVPDFTLMTYEPTKGDWGEFSLAKVREAKRWAILVFYPADFTFVCTTEFAALAERHEQFARLGAELVTVSTDSHFVHLAWQRDEPGLKDVKYSMGADRNGDVSRLFGVWDPVSGEDYRGTFIIDPDGVLRASEINLNNVGRNMDELMRKFKAFVHVAKHPGENCTAKWQDEGDATLTASPKLVGNVYDKDGKLHGK
jgi:NADH-dependent peroxiredoxin subunit C